MVFRNITRFEKTLEENIFETITVIWRFHLKPKYLKSILICIKSNVGRLEVLFQELALLLKFYFLFFLNYNWLSFSEIWQISCLVWGGHCSVGLVGPLMFAQYQLVQAIFGPYTIYTLKGSTTTKTMNFALLLGHLAFLVDDPFNLSVFVRFCLGPAPDKKHFLIVFWKYLVSSTSCQESWFHPFNWIKLFPNNLFPSSDNIGHSVEKEKPDSCWFLIS